MKPEILITGATGTTSQYAIRHLLAKGKKVRAMVRTLDDRSKEIESLGVEVVQGDFLDIESLQNALKGIKRAYFLYPFIDHLPKAAGYFAKAAKENKLEMVVAMSQMGVSPTSPSPATQNHYIAEQILDWADIGAVHIRPALFAWNYLGFASPTVADHQKFYYPNPEARYSIVHPADIGEVIGEILADENIEGHTGQKYELSGDRSYSALEVTAEIGEVINKEIEYVPLSVDQWIDAIKDVPTINSFLAKHLREFSAEVADGRFDKTTSDVKDITGHQPRSFRQYIEEHKIFFMNLTNNSVVR